MKILLKVPITVTLTAAAGILASAERAAVPYKAPRALCPRGRVWWGDDIPYLPAAAAKKKSDGRALNVTTLVAHHSFAAEFDAHRPVKLRRTVTRMEWINRHAWIHVNVKAVDGTMVA